MCRSSRKYNVLLREGVEELGSTAASRENFGVVSWNVAGISATLLSSFLLHLSIRSPWSVLCLQEAVTKTEGLLSSSSLDGTDEHQHVVFTRREVKRGLRAPAIIARSTSAKNCVFVGSGQRWVAVLFRKMPRIFVSLHMPHSRLPFDLFSATLHEIRHQLLLFSDHKFFVGVDANVKLAGCSDGSLIGDAVLRADLSCPDRQRTCAFVEFLQDCSLMVCNTWTHEAGSTRREWSSIKFDALVGSETQCDFVLVSAGTHFSEVWVMKDIDFSSDHWPVSVSCAHSIGGCPMTMPSEVHVVSAELQELFALKKNVSDVVLRRKISETMWRLRRKERRKRAVAMVASAVEAQRATK